MNSRHFIKIIILITLFTLFTKHVDASDCFKEFSNNDSSTGFNKEQAIHLIKSMAHNGTTHIHNVEVKIKTHTPSAKASFKMPVTPEPMNLEEPINSGWKSPKEILELIDKLPKHHKIQPFFKYVPRSQPVTVNQPDNKETLTQQTTPTEVKNEQQKLSQDETKTDEAPIEDTTKPVSKFAQLRHILQQFKK